MTLPGFLFFPCLMDQQAAEMPVSREVSFSFFPLKPKGQTAGRVELLLGSYGHSCSYGGTSLRVTIWDWT